MIKTAIIADDHALFRAGLASLLKTEFGYTVVEADSFDSAVDQLSSKANVDLAIFDLSMPGMKSAGSLRSIREGFPSVKTVVITGSSARGDILSALGAGVHGFVMKTIGPEATVSALRYVMSGSIYVPPEITRLELSEQVEPSIDPIERLTPRQRQILEHLAKGDKSNKEIARALDLTENTVKVHVNSVFRVLGIHDRREVAQILATMKAHNRAEARSLETPSC